MVSFRKLICKLFGHSLTVASRIDNGQSQFGHMVCGRCDHEPHYQYDYDPYGGYKP